MSEERNWTHSRIPGAEIYWVETYCIEVDAMIGAPVWLHSVAAKKGLERGIIRKIEEARAAELNRCFANEGVHSVKYLKEFLDARWRTIAMQMGAKVS